VLENLRLREGFRVEHLDTTDPRPLANLGRWDIPNIALGLRAAVRLLAMLRGQRGILYLPLSENAGGFLRDSFFIHLAALRHWKIALHIRNSMFRQFYASQSALYRGWIRLTMRRVSGLAVLGESLRHLFDGLIAPGRVAVVPNGTPDVKVRDVQANPNRVLYLSNFCLKKGIDHAVETAIIVQKRNPTAEFVFAGEWEDEGVERRIRGRIASDGDRITFLRPVRGEQKDRLLASAWVLLFPVAWGEGHPRILLEALAAGVPPVTTNRATIAETVIDGESGFVVADPDPQTLADKVSLLLSNPELRDSMSRAARERYLDRFTQGHADRALANWLTAMAGR
jgi:glycosyltransferase involved in cell wall biosynthesis